MKPVHPCGVKPREHAGIPIGDEAPRHRDDDEEGEHHGVTGNDLGDGVDRLCADPLFQDVDGRGHDIVRFRFRGCICLDEGADFLLRAFILTMFSSKVFTGSVSWDDDEFLSIIVFDHRLRFEKVGYIEKICHFAFLDLVKGVLLARFLHHLEGIDMANPFYELFARIRPAFIDIVDRKRIGTVDAR